MKDADQTTRTVNLRPISFVVALGFVVLLSLIWFIGSLATLKLDDLRTVANNWNADYNHRLKLATEIRAETLSVIAAAQLYRTIRDTLPVGAPVWRDQLVESRQRLRKLLEEGRRFRSGRARSMQTDEFEAWRQLEAAADEFWRKLDEEERRPSSRNQPAQTPSPAPTPTPAINANSDADTPPSDKTNFYDTRKGLAAATSRLIDVVVAGQQQGFRMITDTQGLAASEISRIRWITLSVGITVALLTIALAQRQIKQIRRATKLEQEARGFANSVFDSQTNSVLAFDKNGTLLAANRAFVDGFKDKIQLSPTAAHHYRTVLASLPEVSAFIGEVLENESFSQGRRERIAVRPTGDGETRLIDVYISPLTIAAETRGRVVMLVDVTAVERELEEGRRNRTLGTVGQLTAQVAHEIYNPLGAIKLNVELLEMQLNGDDDARHTIARLKRGLDHLSTIVMDLRYLTRPREPERRPTDLNALMDEVIELAGDRLERSRVYVKRAYATDQLTGEYDPLQLRKVFLNLLINAVEASPREGEIELRTRRIPPGERHELNGARGGVAVDVIDRGIGMSPETKRRIFEAFYSTKQHGTGLGMMITHEIIKKHDGRIEIESEEGEGTMVSVYLPA